MCQERAESPWQGKTRGSGGSANQVRIIGKRSDKRWAASNAEGGTQAVLVYDAPRVRQGIVDSHPRMRREAKDRPSSLPRQSEELIRANCWHPQGQFTGAQDKRASSEADGGTLFLDEVARELETQAKVCGADEQRFDPVSEHRGE